jgi:hypothetical protein
MAGRGTDEGRREPPGSWASRPDRARKSGLEAEKRRKWSAERRQSGGAFRRSTPSPTRRGESCQSPAPSGARDNSRTSGAFRMPRSRNASVRRPALHPSTCSALHRDFKLAAIVEAEEKARPDPETHEDMREMMARRLTLLADRWRGCTERLCKRHRYCVKPRAKCTRHPESDPTPLTEASREMYDRIWAQMLAERTAAAPAQAQRRATPAPR